MVFLQLQDLNACLPEDRIQVFMKLTHQIPGLDHLVFIHLEKTPLTSQFLKLCTGEFGAMYKDAPYQDVYYKDDKFFSLIEVSRYNFNANLRSGRIDFVSDSKVPVRCNANDIAVFAWEDGSFVFARCIQDGRGIDIIGKVTSPNLEEFVAIGSHESRKIADSGVIFILKN